MSARASSATLTAATLTSLCAAVAATATAATTRVEPCTTTTARAGVMRGGTHVTSSQTIAEWAGRATAAAMAVVATAVATSATSVALIAVRGEAPACANGPSLRAFATICGVRLAIDCDAR